jgi:hypothetical protein
MAIWHFLENQFQTVTTGRRGLADGIYKDHVQKLTQAAAGNAALNALLAVINTAGAPWADKYGKWKNARAAYRGATQALVNLLDVLKLKPVGGGRSKIDDWDSKIRNHWSPGDPIYDELLPLGREPFTAGTREAIIDEVERLADRLEARAGALLEAAGAPPPPADAALLTEQAGDVQAVQAKVAAFAALLVAARNTQTQKEGLVDQLSLQLEPARKALCTALYKNLGALMALFAENPGEAAAFYDLTLIMSPPAGADEDEPGAGESSASSESGNPPVG